MNNLIVSVFGIVKRVFVVLLVVMTVFYLFIYAIQTDRSPIVSNDVAIVQNSRQIQNAINNSELQKTSEGRKALTALKVFLCSTIGEACNNNPTDSQTNFKHSLFGKISQGIMFPYANSPASGTYWTIAGLRESGFVPKTIAAEGIGFSAMKPLLEIWRLFRNISFALTSLLVIIIGFLIMFRFKINPQTVITAENALPRIALTTLLITFSFAIGGLMIDLMYVVSTVVASVLASNASSPLDPGNVNSIIFQSGAKRLFNDIVINGDTWGIGEHLLNLMPGFINLLVRLIGGLAVVQFMTSHTPYGIIAKGTVAGGMPIIGGVVALLAWLGLTITIATFLPFILSLILIIITALFLFIRILVLLFAAYFRIILNILFSPIILLTGVMPGRNAFGKWIRILAADLAVFPIVISLIIISGIIVKIPSSGNLWQPPFLFGDTESDAIKVIVGIGLLFMIPDIVRSVREYMGVKGSPFKFGLGLFFAGITAGVGGGIHGLGQFGSISHGILGAQSMLSRFTGKDPFKKPPKAAHRITGTGLSENPTT